MLTREANASLVVEETSLVTTNNLPGQKYSTVNFMRKSRQPMTTYLTLQPRGAPRGAEPPPPLGPEKHCIFRVSSVQLRDLHL